VYVFQRVPNGDYIHALEILASDSWEGILIFECADADGYRLPTEAEWEVAARDGQEDGELDFYGPAEEIAVFNRSEVCDVGTMKPTSKGIHDLWGLVYEWTGSKP
jgi:formylglycine-generating enzyme required for sulfatase activity